MSTVKCTNCVLISYQDTIKFSTNKFGANKAEMNFSHKFLSSDHAEFSCRLQSIIFELRSAVKLSTLLALCFSDASRRNCLEVSFGKTKDRGHIVKFERLIGATINCS